MKSKEEIKKVLKKKLRVDRLNLNELNPVDPLQEYRLCFNGYQVFGFKEEECWDQAVNIVIEEELNITEDD